VFDFPRSHPVTRSLYTPVPSETDTQPLIDMNLSTPAAARPGYIGRADTGARCRRVAS